MPLISLNHWIGASKEATSGTAEASPKIYIPLESGGWKTQVGKITPKETRGVLSKEHVSVQTVNMYSAQFKSIYYTDTVWAWLWNILGDAAHTQPDATDNPNVHQYVGKLKNSARPTWTFYENRWQTAGTLDAYAGGVVDKFNAKFVPASSLFDVTTDLKALHHSVVSGALPTTTFTSEVPFAAAGVVVQKASSSFIDLTDMEIDISANHGLEKGSDGTNEYTYLTPGDFMVRLKGTFFASKTEFDKYLASSEEAFDFKFTGANIPGSTGNASPIPRSLEIAIPRSQYNTYDIDYSKQLQMGKVDITAFYSQSDATPIIATNVTDVGTTHW